MMKRFRVYLACTAAGVMLSACTQGATGPPGISSVNPITSSKLQLVVGTANIEGNSGLNVVSTLRQANGDSAVLVDTPTLTGPFTYALPSEYVAGGGFYNSGPGFPSYQEFTAASPALSGTSQFLIAGT